MIAVLWEARLIPSRATLLIPHPRAFACQPGYCVRLRRCALSPALSPAEALTLAQDVPDAAPPEASFPPRGHAGHTDVTGWSLRTDASEPAAVDAVLGWAEERGETLTGLRQHITRVADMERASDYATAGSSATDLALTVCCILASGWCDMTQEATSWRTTGRPR